MAGGAARYLLDTNIVLHWTRQGSAVAAEIERQFQLKANPFKPLICEVTLAEILTFARGAKWGAPRLAQWAKVEQSLTAVAIGDRAIYEAYADLHSLARSKGWPIQHDHNDIWIGATAKVAGAQLLSTDAKAFLPLRGAHLDVVVLDARSGIIVP